LDGGENPENGRKNIEKISKKKPEKSGHPQLLLIKVIGVLAGFSDLFSRGSTLADEPYPDTYFDFPVR
jgi:hypothetical protein